MPKVKYDVSNVEDSGSFKQAPVALYVLKVAEFNVGESNSGQPMGTVVFEVVKDAKGKKLKEQYGRVWHRIPLEHWDDTAGWTFRLKEFIKACNLKEKGALDTDKIVGTEMLGKLKADKDLEGEYRPAVGKLMPLDKDADEDEPDDEPDEDEDADEDEGDDEEYTADDLKELDDDDLLEVADEFEVKKPKGDLDKKKRKKLIAAILEAQEEQEDEDEDDEDDEEEDEDSYDDMSKSALVKEARSRKLKVKSDMDEDDIREMLREDDAEEEDDDDDTDEEEDDAEDYDEWSVEKLKAELKERGLKTSGSKKVLAARLEKDDEEDDDDGDPF